jgi:predicted transcriptional regulator
MTKKRERGLATQLRLRGETIPTIAKTLGVSKASVSLWMRGVEMPEAAKLRMGERNVANRALAQEARRARTREKLAEAADEAQAVVQEVTFTPKHLLVLCSLMYWCEGAKSKNDAEFTFTNADPVMVAGFLAFLRAAVPLDESRFRVRMHLHAYHDGDRQRRFWSKITGIPEKQFTNIFWKSNSGKSIKPDYPGCIHLRYYDVVVARKISAVARAFLASMLH